MRLKFHIQSVSDLITNSSSEVFIIYTKEGIESFKEIVSTLIGEDFDNRFTLELIVSEWGQKLYEDENSDLTLEEWCFNHDQNEYESTYIEGLEIKAKDQEYANQARALNQIYNLFESEERYC